MAHIMNAFLKLIKWPLACLTVVLLIPALKTDLIILNHIIDKTFLFLFFLPMMATGVLWLVFPSLSESFPAIFEHEATHMIFALLTGHMPKNMEITQGRGGYISFYGEGNWLIALAPYFFPTFAVLVVLAGLLYPLTGEQIPEQYMILTGIMTGYHLASNIQEIHSEQTDFQVAGRVFSLFFLPTANLISYGILITFSRYEYEGLRLFFKTLAQQTSLFLSIFI